MTSSSDLAKPDIESDIQPKQRPPIFL